MATETATKGPTAEIDTALARATLFSALALGFRPPEEETIARLCLTEVAVVLAGAAAILDSDGESGLVAAMETVARAGNVGVEALSSSHRALFGHTARGAVPPYETEYGNEALFQQPQELGDLMGFYHAFGLTINCSAHERLDHISCECEFLSFLAMKEAYALEQGDTEMRGEINKAQKLFLKDHLGRFLPTIAQKLADADPSGFYAALAQLCLSFAVQESARFSIPLGGANLPLRPADDDRVPMACGSGGECADMPGSCMPDGDDSV